MSLKLRLEEKLGKVKSIEQAVGNVIDVIGHLFLFKIFVVCKVIGYPTVKCFKTDRAVVPPAPLVTPTGGGGSWSPAPLVPPTLWGAAGPLLLLFPTALL